MTQNQDIIEIKKQFVLKNELPFALIYRHLSLPILLVKYKKNSVLNLKNAEIIVEKVYPFVSEGINLVITDSRENYDNSDEKARALLSDNKSLKLIKAHAILVKELPMRISTSHFIVKNQPITEFKQFKSLENAISWLINYE